MTTYDDLCDSVAERVVEDMDTKTLCCYAYESLFNIYQESPKMMLALANDLEMWRDEDERLEYLQIIKDKIAEGEAWKKEVSDEPV
ncbi:MAG TPA: hypothetical protein EYF95_02665 [Flavobacteriales bacterium]|nr:hypothetical protein [Flavobacteriales bacterium]